MKHATILKLVASVTLLLVLTGCGGKAEPAPNAPTAASQPEPAAAKATVAPVAKATTAPAAKATQAPAPTVAPEPEEADLTLNSRDTGLEKLTSYRASWHAEWTGTENGVTKSGAWDWEEEYVTTPEKARHSIWHAPAEAGASQGETFEMWQIGATMYMKGGNEGCTAISNEETAKNLDEGFFSAHALGEVDGAKYVGRETVNGIATKHYKYSAKGMSAQGLNEATGETWVAIDGGYVVKDTLRWKGGGGLLGMGAQASGEGTWTWQVTDVNQPIKIEPPAECLSQNAALDLPLMADASEQSRLGNMLMYKTASSVAEVAKFYDDALAAAGWKPEGEPTAMGDVLMANYAKADQRLSLMATKDDDGKTQVILNLGE